MPSDGVWVGPGMVSAQRILQDLHICQQLQSYTKNSFSHILKSPTCYWNSNDRLWVFLNLATWIWIVWKPQADSSFVCMRRPDELPKSRRRFPTRNYWAKRSLCSVMRNIYTRTRWTFNVIWFPSRPGLVTEGVRGRTSREKSIRHTWHPVLTSARRSGWWQLISCGTEELLHRHQHTHTRSLVPPHTRLKKPKILNVDVGFDALRLALMTGHLCGSRDWWHHCQTFMQKPWKHNSASENQRD